VNNVEKAATTGAVEGQKEANIEQFPRILATEKKKRGTLLVLTNEAKEKGAGDVTLGGQRLLEKNSATHR